DLAAVVLDASRPTGIRAKAAEELVRHIELNGLALTAAQQTNIRTLAAAERDADLKPRIATVVGSLRPEAKQTGERIQTFTPPTAAPAKEPIKPADPKKPVDPKDM